MKKIITDILISLGILILALLACIAMNSFAIERTYVAMVLVLAVFLISVVTDGFVYGVVASLFAVLMDNFVFAFPYMAFDFLTVENLISGLVMLVVACITCTLTSRIKVQEKMKAEAEKEKMRANLLRAVSHDLRTPLTTIYSASNLILEEGENLPREQQKQLLLQTREESNNLIQMVQNLLSVTKVNTDGVQLAKNPAVLEELIETTLVKFRKHYPAQKIHVQIPERFITIPMDAMLIQQVLMNLLENAVLHAKGMTRLSLTVKTLNDYAVFTVADDGCGIPKERLLHLFDGYMDNGDLPADSRRTGMGIGLSVCASIIKAHGGDIWGENAPQGGARIGFSLKMEESANEQ